MKFYSTIRASIEAKLELFGCFLYQKAIIAIILLVPVVGYLAYQLIFIKVDTSIENYLKQSDSALIAYNNFQNQFGSDERVIIGITAPDIFSPPALEKLDLLQKDLESQVPHIAEVKSLTNALYVESRGDDLLLGVISDLLHECENDSSKLKDLITSSPFYGKQFFSPDRKLAVISLSVSCASSDTDSSDVLAGFDQAVTTPAEKNKIQLCSLNNDENGALIDALQKLKEKYQQDDFQIHLTGMPILRQFLRNNMREDSAKFISLSTLLIIIFLFILFGRLSGVLFPLFIVFCSVTSTVGLMVLLDKPFKAPTMVLPSFLMAVGVGASVHILVLFYQFFGQGNTKQEAIAKALGHSGLPVILTSLTTAAGLASFSTAKVAPVADLGIFAAIGVFISLFYTLVFLPVLIAFYPLKRRNQPLFLRFSIPLKKMFSRMANVSTTHPKYTVGLCVVLLLISCLGITKIKLVHNPLLWLPQESKLRLDTETFSQHFPGLVTVEVLVKTRREQGLMQPKILEKFAELETSLSQFSTEKLSVFNVFSFIDVLKEIHTKLADSTQDPSILPTTHEMISQEILLLESGSPQLLGQLADARFQLGRVTIQAPWVDAMTYGPFLDFIGSQSRKVFKEDAEITLTGIIPLLSQTFFAAIESMITSYVIAVFVISVVMILLIGHFKLGVLSMFPNLLPVFITLGYMGMAGIPLDMYTMLIGSIALGLAVDDTIHFMYNFRRYFEETNEVTRSVKLTLYTSGLAMLITTIVLSGGAFIFMASKMRSLYYFGLLSGVTIVTALMADFFLAPALMALYCKSNEKKYEKKPSC